MTQLNKLLIKILSGTSDQNIDFEDYENYLMCYSSLKELKEVIAYFSKMELRKLLIFSQIVVKQKLIK